MAMFKVLTNTAKWRVTSQKVPAAILCVTANVSWHLKTDECNIAVTIETDSLRFYLYPPTNQSMPYQKQTQRALWKSCLGIFHSFWAESALIGRVMKRTICTQYKFLLIAKHSHWKLSYRCIPGLDTESSLCEKDKYNKGMSELVRN